MDRHTKQYTRTGSGVELRCDGKIVASSSCRGVNFSLSSCPGCGMEVQTIGYSPIL